VGPRAGLDRCGKSRPTGIRSPDRPARSQSLYRLSYPAHSLRYTYCFFAANMVNRKRLIVAFVRILPALFSVYKQLIGRHVGRLLLGVAVMF
jgi:hypothetical protein